MIKTIHRYFRGRWERYYLRSHWHLVLDLSLLVIMVILASTAVGFHIYRPQFPDLVKSYFDPTINQDNPPLDLEYAVTDPIIKLTDAVELKITLKNGASAVINNLKFDFSNTDGDFTIKRMELLKVDPDLSLASSSLKLSKIAAGESREVLVKVYFSRQKISRRINWQAQVGYDCQHQSFQTKVDLPAIIIAALLSVKESAYYTSPQGDQLGIGPLPPVVGIPTSYWVFWEAQGDGDIQNLVFSARLPQGVELGSGRTLLAGDFSYNSSSRQIIWKIADLKGNSDNYRLGFEIQLTPNSNQLGTVPLLLTNSRYYGIDAVSRQELKGSLKDLNTNLEDDHFNTGEGKVIE